jgi:hypothetical protein
MTRESSGRAYLITVSFLPMRISAIPGRHRAGMAKTRVNAHSGRGLAGDAAPVPPDMLRRRVKFFVYNPKRSKAKICA